MPAMVWPDSTQGKPKLHRECDGVGELENHNHQDEEASHPALLVRIDVLEILLHGIRNETGRRSRAWNWTLLARRR